MSGNTLGRTPFQPHAVSQAYLKFSKVPAGLEALMGQTLIGAGALPAGTYVCVIATDGFTAMDITLKPSALSGGSFAPTANILRANGEASRTAVAGTNFAAGVAQTLSLTALLGAMKCNVTFTVPNAQTITFAEGTKATPDAIAEYNGA